jgi:curved DNA-binding protein
MEFKDYYDTLGVKADATDAEIKSAYRRLARKFHPDVSKEAGAEEKFKAVNEAYEALREPSRRKAYDELRAGGYRGGDPFRGPPPNWQRETDFGAGDGSFDQESFSDFFESLFGGRTRRRTRRPARAAVRSAARDATCRRADRDSALRTAYQRRASERISLRDGGGGERTLEVKIPAGIAAGAADSPRRAGLRPACTAAPAGDLLLGVSACARTAALHARRPRRAAPPCRSRRGRPRSARTVTVPTLGGDVELRVPAGSDSAASKHAPARARHGPASHAGRPVRHPRRCARRRRRPKPSSASSTRRMAQAYFGVSARACVTLVVEKRLAADGRSGVSNWSRREGCACRFSLTRFVRVTADRQSVSDSRLVLTPLREGDNP